ncbi:hypothetical protein Ahy_B04g068933 isoform H [Arachis hypogaea]|uniref:Uncharacterized protein n=1 Tax=Arachis hypogaea TaxID=3818 RepID=A0A444ZB49_ARAHY|nr:hypothetical protein Ahy_B04g068933 isoform H [Arachis hypogaea]
MTLKGKPESTKLALRCTAWKSHTIPYAVPTDIHTESNPSKKTHHSESFMSQQGPSLKSILHLLLDPQISETCNNNRSTELDLYFLCQNKSSSAVLKLLTLNDRRDLPIDA